MDSRRTVTRRTVLTGAATAAAGATAGAAIPLLTAPAEAAVVPKVGQVLARRLRLPWGLAFLPDGDALVGERPTGRIFRVHRTGGRRYEGTLRAAVDYGEGGLLGIAVSPTFADDRWVYFYLTSARDNRIVRKRYVDGRFGRSHVLLDGIARTDGHGSSNHQGGRLAFSPSGHLFATTGDAARASRSQDDDSPNGKILRLNADGTIPHDNPVRGNPMWTKGHRNVEGLDWDGQGRLWATEFGENTRDELNRIRKGRNYGWPRVEGGDGNGPYADPFATWQPTSTCSPSGVAIAHGRAWVGALAGQCLYSVRLNGPHAGQVSTHLENRVGRIRTVAKAPDGSLWITTSNRSSATPAGPHDRVIRITF